MDPKICGLLTHSEHINIYYLQYLKLYIHGYISLQLGKMSHISGPQNSNNLLSQVNRTHDHCIMYEKILSREIVVVIYGWSN